MVSDPAMYRLAVVISDTATDILVVSRVADNDIIYRHVDFTAGSDKLDAFRDVVYENPLLTADFYRVDVIVDNNRFFVMNADDATDSEIRRRLDLLWARSRTGIELGAMQNVIESGRTVLAWGVEQPLLAFIRRMWNNPSIHHRMAVTGRYYALKNRMGNMGKLYVRATPDRADIFAFGRTGLLLLNSFDTHGSVENAAYYTLAVARGLDFDAETDRIVVGGEPGLRDGTIEILRNFVPVVVPEIAPSVVTGAPEGVPYEALIALTL